MRTNKLSELRAAIEQALGHTISDVQLDAAEAVMGQGAASCYARLSGPAQASAAAVPETQDVSTSTGRKDGITLSAAQLRDALDFVNPDGPDDQDQLEAEVTILWLDAGQSAEDKQDMAAGYYAYLTEYPGEGVYGPLGSKVAQPA